MFRRSISDGRTLAGWFSPGMPVRKIVTRSLRGAGGDWTPKSRLSSFGTSGSSTRSSAAASPVGSMALNTSLRARSITASLTSGIAEARHLDAVAGVGDLPPARASPPPGGSPSTTRR